MYCVSYVQHTQWCVPFILQSQGHTLKLVLNSKHQSLYLNFLCNFCLQRNCDYHPLIMYKLLCSYKTNLSWKAFHSCTEGSLAGSSTIGSNLSASPSPLGIMSP